jgi:hypothetical protein
MADLPGGASGLLVRDDKGKEADRLVTRIGPRRGRPRNWAVEDPREERKTIDASPTAAITLAMICTVAELGEMAKGARGGEIAMGGRPGSIKCRKPSTGCAPW